jgi:nickel-dependent lactate racemase
MRIDFPYYPWAAPVEIPDANLMGVYATAEGRPRAAAEGLVREALAAPVGTPPLRELARDCHRVVIVCDDVSRPTPASRLLPPVLEELAAAGVPDRGIEFLMALGTHRFMTADEMRAKLGDAVVAKYRVHNHDWKNPDACLFVGRTAQGVPVWINRKVMEADLVIGVGRIMPIEVCGFTGGGKILIPGVCGKITNDDMHWTRIGLPDEAIRGKPENPVRESIEALARQAGLDFIVNAVMDLRQQVTAVVAGDMVAAHRRGCEQAMALHAVRIPREADIVVADSYPFDIEFWQANKALDQAGPVVRRGGALILVTPCHEGFSATHEGTIREFGYPAIDDIQRLVRDGRIEHKVVGVHMAQVSRVARERATVFLVTPGIPEGDVRRVGLEYAATPQAALDEAFRRIGRGAGVAVLRGAAEMLPLVGASS